MCSLTTFLHGFFGFDDGSEQPSDSEPPSRRALRTVVKTKKSMEESSQRAHVTFENGADPSGTDRGLYHASHDPMNGAARQSYETVGSFARKGLILMKSGSMFFMSGGGQFHEWLKITECLRGLFGGSRVILRGNTCTRS